MSYYWSKKVQNRERADSAFQSSVVTRDVMLAKKACAVAMKGRFLTFKTGGFNPLDFMNACSGYCHVVIDHQAVDMG
jgi:hypothetical protein